MSLLQEIVAQLTDEELQRLLDQRKEEKEKAQRQILPTEKAELNRQKSILQKKIDAIDSKLWKRQSGPKCLKGKPRGRAPNVPLQEILLNLESLPVRTRFRPATLFGASYPYWTMKPEISALVKRVPPSASNEYVTYERI
jgi:hypothetical protein